MFDSKEAHDFIKLDGGGELNAFMCCPESWVMHEPHKSFSYSPHCDFTVYLGDATQQ